MRKKLLSLALCGVLLALAGCGQTESPEIDGSKLSQEDIKDKEDILKDSQVHINVEETFLTKFDGIDAVDIDTYNFTDEVNQYFSDNFIDYYKLIPDSFLGYDCFYEMTDLDRLEEPDVSSVYYNLMDYNIEVDSPEDERGYTIIFGFKDKQEYTNGYKTIMTYLKDMSDSTVDLSYGSDILNVFYNASMSKAFLCTNSKGEKYAVIAFDVYEDFFVSSFKDVYCGDSLALVVLSEDCYNSYIQTAVDYEKSN